jgi:hypothetical protein
MEARSAGTAAKTCEKLEIIADSERRPFEADDCGARANQQAGTPKPTIGAAVRRPTTGGARGTPATAGARVRRERTRTLGRRSAQAGTNFNATPLLQ